MLQIRDNKRKEVEGRFVPYARTELGYNRSSWTFKRKIIFERPKNEGRHVMFTVYSDSTQTEEIEVQTADTPNIHTTKQNERNQIAL